MYIYYYIYITIYITIYIYIYNRYIYININIMDSNILFRPLLSFTKGKHNKDDLHSLHNLLRPFGQPKLNSYAS